MQLDISVGQSQNYKIRDNAVICTKNEQKWTRPLNKGKGPDNQFNSQE